MITQLTTLDGSKLKAIAHSTPTAEITVTSLALRERLRHSSDIQRTKSQLIRDGEKIVDADYMKLWKDLQDAGIGSIIYGRKGRPDRFEWHYSLKSVAKAALEGTNEQVSKLAGVRANVQRKKPVKVIRRPQKVVAPVAAKPTPKAMPVAAPVLKSSKLAYIPLRNDFNVEISVPSDLTKAEAEVLSNAIRRLSA